MNAPAIPGFWFVDSMIGRSLEIQNQTPPGDCPLQGKILGNECEYLIPQ
jgi:hypothetical protein